MVNYAGFWLGLDIEWMLSRAVAVHGGWAARGRKRHITAMVFVPPSRKRRRWIKWVALAVVAIAALLWWRPWSTTPDFPQQAMRTVTVQTGDVEDVVSALGTIEALQYVDVGAQVS